jgi:hypothetical protein
MADVDGGSARELIPFERLGPLVLGMPRDEAVRLLGQPSATLEEQPLLVEAYDDVQSGYDRACHLVAVHTGPGRAVTFRGIQISDRAIKDVEAHLRDAGVRCEHDDDGALVLPDLGVEFFAEELSYKPGVVQDIFVKARDYSAATGSPTP